MFRKFYLKMRSPLTAVYLNPNCFPLNGYTEEQFRLDFDLDEDEEIQGEYLVTAKHKPSLEHVLDAHDEPEPRFSIDLNQFEYFVVAKDFEKEAYSVIQDLLGVLEYLRSGGALKYVSNASDGGQLLSDAEKQAREFLRSFES